MMKTTLIFSLLLTLVAAPPASAKFSVEGFELVESAPVETTLSDPGLRSAAEAWPAMIARSQKTLDIAQFYIAPMAGEPLDPVLDALRTAVRRGVRVRMLLEKKFEKVSGDGIALLRTIPGIELRIIDISKMQADGILHAKYFVMDGKEAYLGSQNFDWRSLKHIHELGLRITDPKVVGSMSAVFEHDWDAQERIAAGKTVRPIHELRPAAAVGDRAYLVASPFAHNPKGVGDSESELARLIGTAEKELTIELLDYAPLTRAGKFYPPIDNALRAAAARGVQIRLLVSHWNTSKPHIDHLKSLSVLPKVEVRILTVPPASTGYVPFARVIHAKYMVIDSRVLWLGTSNWTGGYLDNSRNLEVVVKDALLAEKAKDVHKRLWESEYSKPIELLKDYPKPKK